ncbi:MAG: hypothetical protein LBE49_09505, partial [Deltaproteobacteria bacterium]|nr:hypothetical protein [Deltaproteobacteria bacterium]
MSDIDDTSASEDPAKTTGPLPYKYKDVAWKSVALAGYDDLFNICLPPKGYAQLDFISYDLRKEFEKHLQVLLPSSRKGEIIVDFTIEIPWIDRLKTHPLIMLVEFQDSPVKDFASRMYKSMLRLSVQYPENDIAALAIFTGTVSNGNEFSKISEGLGGITAQFNSYQVPSLDELRKNPHPFCRVFHAALLAAELSKKTGENTILEVQEKAAEVFEDLRKFGRIGASDPIYVTVHLPFRDAGYQGLGHISERIGGPQLDIGTRPIPEYLT